MSQKMKITNSQELDKSSEPYKTIKYGGGYIYAPKDRGALLSFHKRWIQGQESLLCAIVPKAARELR